MLLGFSSCVFGLVFCLPVLAKPGVLDQIKKLEDSHSPLLQYPTQFTQSIAPKRIHSHNDYWREVPLLTALSFGVSSVEADVWLMNGTLYVGHEIAALTKERTLDALYIQPLLKIVQGQNPETEFNTNTSTINGVWDTASSVPLQLLIDLKTDGEKTLPFVLDALEPLREAGYLTTFADGTLTKSAITVVGTGNTPLDGVLALSPRDYFFDAPLVGLKGANVTFDATVSPIASTDYEVAVGWDGINEITSEQQDKLTQLIGDAHSAGIAARFWDTPDWPIFARTNIWNTLLQAGADWLNADDLEAASKF